MTIDQEFIEYIVKALVNQPERVRVERVIDEKGVLLTLHVDDDDLGRVIGKRGLTAQSLRVLLRALGSKSDAHYNLRIADGNPPPSPPADDDQDSQDQQPVADDSSDAGAETEAETETADTEPTEEDETDARLSQTKKELDNLGSDLEL